MLIRFFTIITVLRFLWLKSKYGSIICILLDIPCYYATKTKKKNKLKNVIINLPSIPSKNHHRMDTKCMERYLMQNHPKVIQILCVDNYTSCGWWWPNPLLQARRKSTRSNLGWYCWSDYHWNADWRGRRGRRRNWCILLWCIIWDFLIRKMLL